MFVFIDFFANFESRKHGRRSYNKRKKKKNKKEEKDGERVNKTDTVGLLLFVWHELHICTALMSLFGY